MKILESYICRLLFGWKAYL